VFREGGKLSVVTEEQDEPTSIPASSTLPISEIKRHIKDDSCVLVGVDIHAKSLECTEPARNSKLKRKQVSGPNIDDIENHT
jgi:hypothetical protein